TQIRLNKKARSDRFHPHQLSPFRMAQRQTLHLLLGRTTPLLCYSGFRALQKLIVSCVLNPGILGIGSCPSQTEPRRIALLVALARLPNDLLLRVPSPEVSPSYRTRVGNPDRVHSQRG